MKEKTKEKLIEQLQQIIDYVKDENIEKLDELCGKEGLNELQYNIKVVKEEIYFYNEEKELRGLFNAYINSTEQPVDEENSEKTSNENEKKLKSNIYRFIKLYATEAEKQEYENLKSVKSSLYFQRKEDVEKYRKECMKYTYVQDVTKLLICESEELFKYYVERKISPLLLKQHALKYFEKSNASEKEQQIILKKIDEYEEYFKVASSENRRQTITRKSQELNDEIIKESKELLDKILESKYSLKVYFEKENLNSTQMRKVLKRIKKHFPEMYEEFEMELKENTQQESRKNMAIAEIMNMKLVKGIEEDYGIRQFDIVDYYLLSKISIDLFIESIKLVKKNETHMLNLITELKKMNKNTSSYFNLEREIECTNWIVSNSTNQQIPITKEDKLEFVQYLKDNNIPINQKTFDAMRIRCASRIKSNVKKSI